MEWLEKSLREDFDLPPKNPSEEAQRRWRSAVGLVKNRRRRFRFMSDLDGRSENESQRRYVQVLPAGQPSPLGLPPSPFNSTKPILLFIVGMLPNLLDCILFHFNSLTFQLYTKFILLVRQFLVVLPSDGDTHTVLHQLNSIQCDFHLATSHKQGKSERI